MERLRRLAGSLYGQLPQCVGCGLTVYETGVYALFSCLHMLCNSCSARRDDAYCPLCPAAQVLLLNYQLFNQIRGDLATALRGMAAGDTSQFPVAFTAFYNLVAVTTQPVYESPPNVLLSGSNPQVPSDTWTCKCGETIKFGDYCTACVQSKPRLADVRAPVVAGCRLCGRVKCVCSVHNRTKDNLWMCVCGFQFNQAEKVRFWGQKGKEFLLETGDRSKEKRKSGSISDRLQRSKSLYDAGKKTPEQQDQLFRMCQEIVTFSKGLQVHCKRSIILRELRLLGIPMSTDSWHNLGLGFTPQSNLSSIQIIHCGLTDQHLSDLVPGLMALVHLKTLDFSGNQLSSWYEISRVISRHGEKRDEVLWALGLRNEEESSPSEGLEEVVLTHNRLTDAALDDLSHVLHTDVWLKAVDLRGNCLSEAGVRQICEVLGENKTLLYVDVRENGVPHDHNLLRVVYNLLRRNFLKYAKIDQSDAGKWEHRLLKMLKCIEPGLLAPVRRSTHQTPTKDPPSRHLTETSPFPYSSSKARTDRGVYTTPRRKRKPCSHCRSLNEQLALAHAELDHLRVENAQMGTQIRTWMNQQYSSSSYSRFTHDLHAAGESALEGNRDVTRKKGGTGEDTDSLTLNRIEQMMSELSHLMDTFEHRSTTPDNRLLNS